MRHLDESDFYPTMGDLSGEVGWTEVLDAEELADVLRSTLHDGYADASDDEMEDALANVLDSLSPAEAFNFGSALNQIGKSASRVVSDPAFASVARTALPVLGGSAGTLIGGPVGTAVGGKLGSLAASALPTPPRPNADNLGWFGWYGASSTLLGGAGATSRAGQAASPGAAVGSDRDRGADQYVPAGADRPGGG